MADITTGAHHGEYSTTTGSGATPTNHLGHNVPSGQIDGTHDQEKIGHHNGSEPVPFKEKAPVEEEEDEDMDALIDDLESQDGHVEDAEEEEETVAGGARPVAEDMLQTDTRIGLTETEVAARRKKYGLNQMKEEKENLILKFLGYFIGPIQFVMEVSYSTCRAGFLSQFVHWALALLTL